MSETSAYVENARGYAQGEIFLMKGEPGHLDALVFNTTGLNQCPPEQFDAIDVDTIAKETESDAVWKNPRRFWMMDHLTIALVGEPRDFQGLDVQLRGEDADARQLHARSRRPGRARVSPGPDPPRHQVRVPRRGDPVFLLRSPEGITWVMQTYTNHKATDLTAADLPKLGERLKLRRRAGSSRRRPSIGT